MFDQELKFTVRDGGLIRSLGQGTSGDKLKIQYLSGWQACLMSSEATLVSNIKIQMLLPQRYFIVLMSETQSGCPFSQTTVPPLFFYPGIQLTLTGKLFIVLLMLKVGTGFVLKVETNQNKSVFMDFRLRIWTLGLIIIMNLLLFWQLAPSFYKNSVQSCLDLPSISFLNTQISCLLDVCPINPAILAASFLELVTQKAQLSDLSRSSSRSMSWRIFSLYSSTQVWLQQFFITVVLLNFSIDFLSSYYEGLILRQPRTSFTWSASVCTDSMAKGLFPSNVGLAYITLIFPSRLTGCRTYFLSSSSISSLRILVKVSKCLMSV